MTDRTTRQEEEVYEKLRHLTGAGGDERLAAAWNAYQDARTDGLCFEGAWEIAVAALRAPSAKRTTAGGEEQRRKKP